MSVIASRRAGHARRAPCAVPTDRFGAWGAAVAVALERRLDDEVCRGVPRSLRERERRALLGRPSGVSS